MQVGIVGAPYIAQLLFLYGISEPLSHCCPTHDHFKISLVPAGGGVGGGARLFLIIVLTDEKAIVGKRGKPLCGGYEGGMVFGNSIGILRDSEIKQSQGQSIANICHEKGIREAIYYR